jgi:nucleotide-binding universal stress UspA family protein
VTPLFLQGRDIANSLYESASVGTDLVVMATRGLGILRRFIVSSVADVLMQRLSVPVLFTRGFTSPADLSGDPLMRHILITLNGSKFAEQILDPAFSLGELSRADHTLLRIVPAVIDYSVGYPGILAPQSLLKKQYAEAGSYLRRVAQRLATRNSRTSPRVVLDNQSIAKAILNSAQSYDADMIALATRGRGMLARLLQGSVADQVVRRASTPVLVLKSDDDQEGRAIPGCGLP